MEAYFDNSATTKALDSVRDIMVKTLMEDFGNPSAMHKKGMEAENYVRKSAQTLAKLLKVNEKEILFTSGGTESDNLAIIGGVEANKRMGNHIITTAVEHAAVAQPFAYLKEQGYKVTILPVDHQGVVKLDALEAALRPDTILVSVMYVNNEVGAVMPVEEIGKLVHEKSPKALFHVDAIQAFGKYRIYPKKLGIDLLSVSSHKIHGPKGVGAVYIRQGVRVPALIVGGGQEKGLRAGTENTAGIIGMGLAAAYAKENMEANAEKTRALRDKLIEGILAKIPEVRLNGHPTDRLPNNVNVSIRYIEGEGLLLLLDHMGIAASSGSACTSGSLDPSHVLLAIGLPHEIAHGSLRLTLSEENSSADVDYVLEQLPLIVEKLRAMSPLYHK